jgi:hypothetical protein
MSATANSTDDAPCHVMTHSIVLLLHIDSTKTHGIKIVYNSYMRTYNRCSLSYRMRARAAHSTCSKAELTGIHSLEKKRDLKKTLVKKRQFWNATSTVFFAAVVVWKVQVIEPTVVL